MVAERSAGDADLRQVLLVGHHRVHLSGRGSKVKVARDVHGAHDVIGCTDGIARRASVGCSRTAGCGGNDRTGDVTTFEVELEQEKEKTEKIAQVAARGARSPPNSVRIRTQSRSSFVTTSGMSTQTTSMSAASRICSAWSKVTIEPRCTGHAARAVITIRTPSRNDDGWTVGGATVVQIVTDDRPFLVDSVTMEVLRQGWSIREVFHPQFLVRRDLEGNLQGIVRVSEAEHDPRAIPESWMHLEILPPARPDGRESLVSDLEHGLLEVLRLVEEAVQDWQKMITRSEDTIEMLKDPEFIGDRAEQADLACELLSWLERQPLHLPRLPRVRRAE